MGPSNWESKLQVGGANVTGREKGNRPPDGLKFEFALEKGKGKEEPPAGKKCHGAKKGKKKGEIGGRPLGGTRPVGFNFGMMPTC